MCVRACKFVCIYVCVYVRYKQQKQMEQKLSELRALVDGGSVDEEVMREFYLLQVRRWITVALEEIESIDQEVQILRRMPSLSQVL